MPLKLRTIKDTLLHTAQQLQHTNHDPIEIAQKDLLRIQLETELRYARKISAENPLDQLGMRDLTSEEWETVLVRDLEYVCDQLRFLVEHYRKLISKRENERVVLLQNNTDMNGVSRKLYQYNDDNSRHLEHLSENKHTFYERDIENYNVEHIRIQKANKILIGEIRDLLTLCFGSRKSSVDSNTLLSTEILNVLENCIRKHLDTTESDKHVEVPPTSVSNATIQFLLSANIIQKDKKNPHRVKIVDFYR